VQEENNTKVYSLQFVDLYKHVYVVYSFFIAMLLVWKCEKEFPLWCRDYSCRL